MSGQREERWCRKIEAVLDRFDFSRCIVSRIGVCGRGSRLPNGGSTLLFPSEEELRRLAGKLLRRVADDPRPVSRARAAGLVALKHKGELVLFVGFGSRVAC